MMRIWQAMPSSHAEESYWNEYLPACILDSGATYSDPGTLPTIIQQTAQPQISVTANKQCQLCDDNEQYAECDHLLYNKWRYTDAGLHEIGEIFVDIYTGRKLHSQGGGSMRYLLGQ